MDGDLMDDMDEIVQEFLVESSENLDQLDRDLLALEATPDSRDKLSSAFRTIHTIKGTSGFLAFGRLEKLTHTGESLLSRLRDGHQRMTTPTADALLAMVDTVRALLASIEATGTEGDVEIEAVMEQIRAQVTDSAAGPVPAAQPVAAAPIAAPVDAPAPVAAPAAAPAPAAPVASPAAASAPTVPVDGPAAAAPAQATAVPQSPAPQTPAPQSPAPQSPAPQVAEPAAKKTVSHARSAAESTLRVDVDLLDALMRLAGELVLTRNQLLRGVGEIADPALSRTAQRLNVITTDIQESIMRTRMQPIDHLWSKLPRVVRDLGAQCGRLVRLTMTGQDTELDRALLEAIKDPLTHLVRNAVDHGIEDPAVREAAGKPREGTLSLRAYHNSGQVVIEVGDDGAGIDPVKIRAKAIERGSRTAAQLAEMSDTDILQLVFDAGFSTAAAVTNVSGRGVGMDVVKTNLEAIGGTIELDSVVGQGTVCRMRVPLTLAIVPALTVEAGSDRYAVAQASLLELVALDPTQAASQIETVAGAPVYRLRGALLPLISLSGILSGRDSFEVPQGQVSQVIVVLQAGNRRFGLLVDRVLNTEEIVVKALSPRLKTIGVYSGATILGDGTVALILDVQNLARRALRADAAERAAEANAARAVDEVGEAERLLIAGVGDGSQVAIPMSMVTRLEMISAGDVESVGSREVVQYRGKIIPLVRLDRHLGVYSQRQPSELPVAVYSQAGHSVAIVMDEIIDIVEYAAADRSEIDDRGFVGSVVVRGQIVGLLDVEQAIAAADPGFFSAVRAELAAAEPDGGLTAFLPAARTGADDGFDADVVTNELVGVNGR
jgi:two-component system chemotaxis sensor kinase CheA